MLSQCDWECCSQVLGTAVQSLRSSLIVFLCDAFVFARSCTSDQLCRVQKLLQCLSFDSFDRHFYSFICFCMFVLSLCIFCFFKKASFFVLIPVCFLNNLLFCPHSLISVFPLFLVFCPFECVPFLMILFDLVFLFGFFLSKKQTSFTYSLLKIKNSVFLVCFPFSFFKGRNCPLCFLLLPVFLFFRRRIFFLVVRVDSFWSFLFYLFTFPIQKPFQKLPFWNVFFSSSFPPFFILCPHVLFVVSPCFLSSPTLFLLLIFVFFSCSLIVSLFSVSNTLLTILCILVNFCETPFFCFLLFPKYSFLSVSFFFLLDIFSHLFSMFFSVSWKMVSRFFLTLLLGFLFHSSFENFCLSCFGFFQQIWETSSFFLFPPFFILFFLFSGFFKSFVCEIIVFI